MNFKKLVFLLIMTMIFFYQCEKDDSKQDSQKGTLSIEITDAPIDNTNIEGVFMTFTAVELDGQRFDLESNITLDVMAYQNGNTTDLWSQELNAESYSEVRLIVDYEKDQDGNSPGCYVQNKNGEKDDLNQTTLSEGVIFVKQESEISINEKETKNVVVDIDLRKAIVADADNTNYSFQSDLTSSARLVVKDESATIKGKMTDALGVTGDKVIVYAYTKGTFNSASQTSGDEDGFFADAITSASVSNTGDYQLSFLNDGDYEVYFVSYETNQSTGNTEAKAIVKTDLDITGELLGINLGINATVELNVAAIGLLPI